MIDGPQRAAFTEQLRARRRRGRPRAASPKVVINVRVPQHVYDALCKRAMLERASLPVLVRQALEYSLNFRN